MQLHDALYYLVSCHYAGIAAPQIADLHTSLENRIAKAAEEMLTMAPKGYQKTLTALLSSAQGTHLAL